MYRFVTLFQVLQLLGWRGLARILRARLSGSPVASVWVAEIGRELTFRFNNSDLVILLGVFLHRDCDIQLSPPPATILDLGANAGYTIAALRHRFPTARIIGLEPDPDSFATCQANHRSDANTLILPRAAAAASGQVASIGGDLIAMARQFADTSAGSAPGAITASSLGDLLTEFDCAGPILLKMDIEGAERAIFQAPAWLARVHAILVEPHGPDTAELLRTTLVAHGFTVSVVGEKLYGRRTPW
jgi:FkbM family methyltransferase